VAGSEAALVVTDLGYLRIQRRWREEAAEALPCQLIQVESDVIVPVEIASEKEEYAAATIRKKIHKRLYTFLRPVAPKSKNGELTSTSHAGIPSAGKRVPIDTLDDNEMIRFLEENGADTSVKPVDWIRGGQDKALQFLNVFLKERLTTYDSLRNDPSREMQSNMSPFLHFGHISPLTIVLRLLDHEAKNGRRPYSAAAPGEFRLEALSPGAQAFIEELVVRRELSANFCRYNRDYDSLNALPSWALATLTAHEKDRRQYQYSLKQLENAKTHDPYWNAAAAQMYQTGKMHGYMRMYWGKKIIEWSKDIKTAYANMLYLNNKYFLDGRDINSYTGVAWCFGKHDRPWKEREIFGKIRYMNARGLERKFDIKEYVSQNNPESPAGAAQ
jgi:deoxyribodipyrimidine photo-lyase